MGMSSENIQVYTVKEVARLLKTTCQQVRRMIQNGELVAVKVGREWRISDERLKEFLEDTVIF